MAIAAPSDDVIRLLKALGVPATNTREVTLRMAVNEAVSISTVEYATGEQIDALAAELKERQYRLTRWISVDERLPEEGQSVLVWMPDLPHAEHGIDIGSYMMASYGVDWMVSGGRSAFPTHWMPLPEPPMTTK